MAIGTADAPELAIESLTDSELADAVAAGRLTWAEVTAECDKRDAYRRRSRAARHAARKRAEPDGWSEAAHAQALELEQVTRGYVLTDYGKRQIRGPVFPALWHIADREVDRYLTEEAEQFFRGWPRLTVPAWHAQLAADEAAAEEADRAERAAAAPVATAPRPVRRPAAPVPAAPVPAGPGSIARYTAALSTLADHANAIAAAMARRNRR